jgi:hypothetical protein
VSATSLMAKGNLLLNRDSADLLIVTGGNRQAKHLATEANDYLYGRRQTPRIEYPGLRPAPGLLPP